MKVNLPKGVCLDEKSGELEQSVEQESFITDIVLVADDSHYFTNEDKIKFDNLYKADKGLYIKSFDNSKIIIAGTPIGSVEANITITDKNTQSSPKACGIAPDTWNGNGNIRLISSSSNLEYRLKMMMNGQSGLLIGLKFRLNLEHTRCDIKDSLIN